MSAGTRAGRQNASGIVPTHAGPKGEVSMGKQVETLPIEGSLHIKDKYVHLDSQCIV